jgi:hypothetical protein
MATAQIVVSTSIGGYSIVLEDMYVSAGFAGKGSGPTPGKTFSPGDLNAVRVAFSLSSPRRTPGHSGFTGRRAC